MRLEFPHRDAIKPKLNRIYTKPPSERRGGPYMGFLAESMSILVERES